MKVFFCAHDIVEFDGNSYYSNPISTMIERYKAIGTEIICYATIIYTSTPHGEIIDQTNVRFIDAPKIVSLSQIFKIKKFYSSTKAIMEQCDCAIIHIHVALINTLCVYIATKINLPYVTVVVGCAWDALWNHSTKGKIMAPLCYIAEKWCQHVTKYSIYVTTSFLQKRYPMSGKSIACSNVELNFIEKINDLSKTSRQNNNKKTIRLGTVAAIDVKYKGQQYVLQALSMLPRNSTNYEYHIVGGGNPQYLNRIATKYNVQDQLFIHGALPHNEIANFLDGIDIYIQPSLQEGLPRSVIEAMSRGCLCMGSNIAGIPELIDKKYLFSPKDIKSIAKIIEKITPIDLERQRVENKEQAKRYDKEILDYRRSEFLNQFAIDNNLKLK